MKKLFFLYVWLNLTRIAELRKEDLVKHIKKEQFRRVDYFFRLPLHRRTDGHTTSSSFDTSCFHKSIVTAHQEVTFNLL